MPNYFVCETDRSPVAYRCSENVTFHIRYRAEGKTVPAPFFAWEVAADFGYRASGHADGSTGELTLCASLDRPGFIFVKVTAVNADGEPCPDADVLYGGAGVSVAEIAAVTEEPRDYAVFWRACGEELFSVAPTVIEQKELAPDAEHPNHQIYDMKVACAGNAPVSGILTIPQDGMRHPARAIYQGYGVKSAWFDFSDEEIQFCINAHGIRNGEEQTYYDGLSSGALSHYGFDEEQNRSPYTCYFKNMMLRAAQALRFLQTLPAWDRQGLFVRGGSQGAVQAMHAAVMIPQVNDAYLFVPWLCDTGAGKIGRLCGWGEQSGAAIPYFDLTLRAREMYAKVKIDAGLGDYTSPPAGVMAMANRLPGEKELNFIQSREHIYISPEAASYRV